MPRGVRLTQAEKDARQALKDAKLAEKRFNFMKGIKRTYKRKTEAERNEKLFNFMKRTPRKRLSDDEKFERALKKQERQQLKALKTASLQRAVEKGFLTPKPPSKPRGSRPRLTADEKFERALRKQERQQLKALKTASLQRAVEKGFLTPKPPLTAEQIAKRRASAKKSYEKRKLLKQGRALQALADTIPLPADGSRRVRVLRQYDVMGRPRINPRVAT
jgi:hypothetical protein